MCISPDPLKQQVTRLALPRHINFMDPRCVAFKMYKAFERKLPTNNIGE